MRKKIVWKKGMVVVVFFVVTLMFSGVASAWSKTLYDNIEFYKGGIFPGHACYVTLNEVDASYWPEVQTAVGAPDVDTCNSYEGVFNFLLGEREDRVYQVKTVHNFSEDDYAVFYGGGRETRWCDTNDILLGICDGNKRHPAFPVTWKPDSPNSKIGNYDKIFKDPAGCEDNDCDPVIQKGTFCGEIGGFYFDKLTNSISIVNFTYDSTDNCRSNIDSSDITPGHTQAYLFDFDDSGVGNHRLELPLKFACTDYSLHVTRTSHSSELPPVNTRIAFDKSPGPGEILTFHGKYGKNEFKAVLEIDDKNHLKTIDYFIYDGTPGSGAIEWELLCEDAILELDDEDNLLAQEQCIQRDYAWNENVAGNPCCGNDGDGDRGELNRIHNIEYICTQNETGRWSWESTADYDMGENNPLTYTKIIEGTNINYLDLLNDYRMPEGRDTDGWIGCKAGDDFPVGAFETSTADYNSEDPHIKNLYDKIKLTGTFATTEDPDRGNVNAQGMAGKEVSLMETNYLGEGDTGDISKTCASQGGTECQTGQICAGGYFIAASDTTMCCYAGTCQAAPSLGGMSPEFICVKRNNVGFWAGCGSAITSYPAHNFYPGSLPTTFKDFGATKFGDGISDQKPGTKYIFNKVLALGVYDVSSDYSQYGWEYEIDPTKYTTDYFYDWKSYDALEFYFYAVKKPELFKFFVWYYDESAEENKLLKEFNITNKSTNTDKSEEKRWHHILIRISEISDDVNKLNKISAMGVTLGGSEIRQLRTVTPDIFYPSAPEWAELTTTGKLYNLLFFDRFTLISQNENYFKRYYCAFKDTTQPADGSPDVIEWITDLTDAQACNEQPGHIWTGAKCCGDDSGESYNDNVNDYACLNGEGIANDELVSFESMDLLNWKGEFYGCSLATAPTITDWDSSVHNKNTDCHHFFDDTSDSNYYCDVDDKEWKDATKNHDGSSFYPVTFIDTEKSTKYFVNLVKNGGFEGWDISRPLNYDDWGVVEKIGTDKVSGVFSLKITRNAQYNGLRQELITDSNVIDSLKGKDIVISFYAKKISDVDDTDTAGIRIRFCDNDASCQGSYIGENIETTITDTEWTYVSETVTVPDDAVRLRIDIYPGIYASDDITNVAYFDNVQVIKYTTTPQESESNCCPATYCWDGSNCIESRSSTDYSTPIYLSEDLSEGYNCINGEWSVFYKKEKYGDPTDFTYSSVDNKCWDGTTLVDAGAYILDNLGYFLTYYCEEDATTGAADWVDASDVLLYDDELYSCSASPPTYISSLGSCELPYNLIEYVSGTTSYDLDVVSGDTYDIKILKTGDDATVTLTATTATSTVRTTIPIDSDFYTGSFTAGASTVGLEITLGTTTQINDFLVMEQNPYPVHHCSADSIWDGDSYIGTNELPTSSGTIDKLRDTEQTTPSGITPTSSGCCPAISCWNGTGCMESRELISTQDYLCVDGIWIESVEKWNPEHTYSSLDCLEIECYDGSGCVEANTGISGTDDYCEGIEESGVLINTSWTSRTKVLALQFLNFVGVAKPGKYTLYCDEQSNALNDPTGLSGTNNFCVLNYDGNVALGTTLNTGKSDFINKLSLGTIDCDDVALTEEEFKACSSDKKIWYNPSLDAIIYAKNDIDLDSLGNWWDAFTHLLRDLFNIKKADATQNIAFVNKQPFDKLYLYNDGSKTITGVLGKEDASDFIFVEYTGFSSDLCAIIDQHNDLAGYCIPSAGTAGTIFTVYIPNAEQKHKAMWQDLTSKLRIK